MPFTSPVLVAEGQRRGSQAPRTATAAKPTPPAPPAFAPMLDKAAARWVETTLKGMTSEQLVGQLLMGRLYSTYLSADHAEFEKLAALVRDVHLGGFCAFGGIEPVPQVMLNPTYGPTILGQPLELAAILNRLQGVAAVPLLVASDFEHGVGMRVSGGTMFPRAMAFGAAGDLGLVREAARIAAQEARAIGVHVNFAPVADVNNNPRNPVINIRSFGEDPGRVGAMVRAAVEGLQAGGVAATLKHFPGHGDTAVDTHLGLATVPHDRARLDRVELAPFRDGIAAGVAGAMVAHVEMPALDPAPGPATLSAPIVSGLLRRDLGFDGVIYTDSMLMDAVSKALPPGEAAVRAVLAGADVVLDPPDLRATYAALNAAVASGRLTRARIEASARRVLSHKARLGLHLARTVNLDGVMTAVGTRAGADLARATAERAAHPGARRPRARAAGAAAQQPRPLPVDPRLSLELAHRRAEPDDDSRAAYPLAAVDGGGALGSLHARGAGAGAVAGGHPRCGRHRRVRAGGHRRGQARSRRGYRRTAQRSVA